MYLLKSHDIGVTLRSIRKSAGMTQRELAAIVPHVSASLISDYETGRRVPTFPVLERVLSALGYELGVVIAKEIGKLRT